MTPPCTCTISNISRLLRIRDGSKIVSQNAGSVTRYPADRDGRGRNREPAQIAPALRSLCEEVMQQGWQVQ